MNPSEIPPRGADWEKITHFALSFDGYEIHGSFDKCADIANAKKHNTLKNLRTCLFFEQRRWHHFGEHPDDESMEYIWSVVEKIRLMVASQDAKNQKLSSTELLSLPLKKETMSTLNLVGAAGEYYVCAELCRQGILAVLTPKNNPIFDIIANSVDGAKSVTIQVKTRSVHNKLGWKLGVDVTKPEKSKGQFIVLVNLHDQKLPDFYIYTPIDLAERVGAVYEKYISTPKKDGSPRKHVDFRWYDEISFQPDDHSRKNDWSLIHAAINVA